MPKKPYHLSHVLKCEFHVLWYETECSARATDAEKVIDPRLGKSHSNMPKATFSVLIRLFCQIHHFPRNSSAPLPNPQRFLPNHWFIANFCKFIISCKKKSSSCHLPHLLCSYLLFPSYWQLPRSHSHHIELSPQLWFICAKFFTFQRVSFPMLLKFCYHWWILTKPYYARVKFISFQGALLDFSLNFSKPVAKCNIFYRFAFFIISSPAHLPLQNLTILPFSSSPLFLDVSLKSTLIWWISKVNKAWTPLERLPEFSIFLMNYAIFLKLCDWMWFEAKCVILSDS